MTVSCPSGSKGRLHDCASVTSAAELRVRNDILKKSVAPTAAEEIWRGDQHAGCDDLTPNRRREGRDAVLRQHLRPDCLDPCDRSDCRTGAKMPSAEQLGRPIVSLFYETTNGGASMAQPSPRKPQSPDYDRPDVSGSEVREPTVNARQGVTEHNVRYILAVSTGTVAVVFGVLLLIYLS